MASNVNLIIDQIIEDLDDDALTHMLAALIFEIAKRDGTTPRRIHELAFRVAPSDEEFNRLRSAL